MYYTRAVASRRIQCVRACLARMPLGAAALATVLLGTVPLSARQLPAGLEASAGAADRAARFITTTDRIERGDAAPIDLIVISKSTTADRAPALVESTKRAVALLDAWLGPLRRDRLSIVDAPWNSRLAGGDLPGVVIVRSRWLTTSRDQSLDRELIAGLSREYWLEAAAQPAFADAAAVYTAGRAIDVQLEGSQFHTDRFIGGFVPFSLRSLALSPAPRDMRPRLRRYDEASWGGPNASYLARVIETAERDLGWASLQQGLVAVRARPNGTLADLASVLSEQRGYDVSALFDAARPGTGTFDYAIGEFESRSMGNQFEVRVTIERRGDRVFNRPLTLETSFADGTSVREPWDAGQQRSTVEYVSAIPAVSASIDPDLVLILDEARSNNTVRLVAPPANRLAMRLAAGWAIWLQNVMLAYSSLV